MILHPVLAERTSGLVGRAGVEEGRRLGTACLERSSALLAAATSPDAAPHPPPSSGDAAGRGRLRGSVGFPGEPRTRAFPRDAQAAPLPHHGRHWSTTNTRGLAAGIVAPVPVAIDAERRDRPRLAAARGYFDRHELERVGSAGPAELVLWTAKEAVLKLERIGLAGLARCRLEHDDGAGRLKLAFGGRLHLVHCFGWKGFLIAVACDTTEAIRLEPEELVPEKDMEAHA